MDSTRNYQKKAHILKRSDTYFWVQWEILEKSNKFKPGELFCRLCTAETFNILYNSDKRTLNELIMQACLHKRQAMLAGKQDDLLSVRIHKTFKFDNNQSRLITLNHVYSRSNMVDHVQSLSIMVDHGQSWSIMVDHGQSWSVMVNHGQS